MAMGMGAAMILPGAKMVRGYAEALLKDVRPDRFARLCNGVRSNHPAWAYGHLAVYPDRLLEAIGRPDLARPDQRFIDLFQNKTEAVDDPNGTIYPPMAEITGRYFDRTDTLLRALPEVSDEVMQRTLNDAMTERLPTVGSRLEFMLGAHSMVHLGQVSAWRRFEGLAAAM